MNTGEHNNPILVVALRYRKLGYSVIPVGENKIPLIKWERFQSELATEEEIKSWFLLFPSANIGIVTGKISSIVVVDVENGGRTDDLPETVKSKTGGGGFHYYYKHPGVAVKTCARIGNKDDKRDIRGDGGYVVAPPSKHASDNLYEWVVPPENTPFAELPKWLIEQERTLDIAPQNKQHGWQGKVCGVSEGERNSVAAEIAGKLLVHIPADDWETIVWPLLCTWNDKNKPPLPKAELRTVFDSIAKRQASKNRDADTKKSHSDLLVALVESSGAVLFHSENQPFISFPMGQHHEVWSCKSKMFRRWLSKVFWDTHHKAVGPEAVNTALANFEGKACFDGKEYVLANRVTWHDNAIWYDMTDPEWRAVKITKEGWQVLTAPILFRRYAHQRQQVEPTRGGDAKRVLQFVNINNEQHKILFMTYVVSCFIPDFPHPILSVYGSQGAAKSQLCKIARTLIDPSSIETASFPRDEKELAQLLFHHWCLFFDNISALPESVSDVLCKAVSGDGFFKRELYSDDDDVIYSFKRCVGINGINLVGTKPDLLERSILLELERIPRDKRRQEKELLAEFERERPAILGGIFDAVVRAMQIKPTVIIENLPRMADFAAWGCAIAEALGYTRQDFLDAYDKNILGQNEVVLGDNVLAVAVRALMENEPEWKGTPSVLLKKLIEIAEILEIDTDREKEWPKAANVLGRRLNELTTNLAAEGIMVKRITEGGKRIIHIRKESGNTVSTVISSEHRVDTVSARDDAEEIPLSLDP